MTISIAILGSTGSIGKSTMQIINKDKSKFSVELLTANNNYKTLIKQAKKFKAKNILISNEKLFKKVKKKKIGNTKIFYGDISINSILKKKIDFCISAIVGINGLKPTVEVIKCCKKVAIANKESIICGWHLIKKFQNKYKTKILPIDSEHFSIMELSRNLKDKDIKEIILTASGGPFLNLPLKKLKYVKPNQSIKHPNWKMGKKISVDSSTLMNKVFELIEAYKIFDFSIDKYKIMIHPQSSVHAIVRYTNGLTKMLLHKTDMKIPISNTIFGNKNVDKNQTQINTASLDKMRFFKVDTKRFPSVKLIKKCVKYGHSTPIIINASNEMLVSLFLKKKVKFIDINRILSKIFRHKDFKKYAKKRTNSLSDIYKVDKWARKITYQMI